MDSNSNPDVMRLLGRDAMGDGVSLCGVRALDLETLATVVLITCSEVVKDAGDEERRKLLVGYPFAGFFLSELLCIEEDSQTVVEDGFKEGSSNYGESRGASRCLRNLIQ